MSIKIIDLSQNINKQIKDVLNFCSYDDKNILIEYLIQHHFNDIIMNIYKDDTNVRILNFALKYENKQIIDFVSNNITNKEELFFLACYNGFLDTTKFLLEKFDITLNTYDTFKWSCIYYKF